MAKVPSRGAWLFVGAISILSIAAFFGIAETAHDREEARNAEIAGSEVRATEHVCADWKTNPQSFMECAVAYRAYEKCELARIKVLEKEGLTGSGVVCEHPVFQFHAREIVEMEAAMPAHFKDAHQVH